MAITLQSSSGYVALSGLNTTTCIWTPGTAAANGNMAVVVLSATQTAATVSTVTGGGVATWTKGKETQSGSLCASVWYGIADGTGGAITATWSAKQNGGKSAIGGAFVGVKTTTPVDVTGTSTGGSATTYTTASSGSTTNAGDVVVAGLTHTNATVTGSLTGPTSSFANFAAPSWAGLAAYLIATATGDYSTSWTDTPSWFWASSTIALFPAAPPFRPREGLRVRQAVNRASTY